MSLFFITSCKSKLISVKKTWDELFEESTVVYEYRDIGLAITAGAKRSYIMKSFDSGTVFVIGTIFNKENFNKELLDTYESCEVFIKDLKNEEQLFYGHYIIIVIREKDFEIEIIPDRIGMLNIYYARDNENNSYISNDLLEVSRTSKKNILYEQAINEFVLTESNVGADTIFKDIYRVEFGNELVFKAKTIYEKRLYLYKIERMCRDDYEKRIEQYFDALNNYKGRVSVDVSAGYDTRLITVIANKHVKNITGFNASHQRDDGVDAEISKIIAKRLGIRLNVVSYTKEVESKKNANIVLHGTSVLRDAERSQKMPYMLQYKYKDCDLALGGYGGEIIRAKYNKYKDIKAFCKDYYKGVEAERICHFKDYSENIENELRRLIIPDGMNGELLQNWCYAVAKMRIWGSGFIQLSCLYGDVIHPFMDWHLLNPLFGFEENMLKDAKLQAELINTYAEELSDIPINKSMKKGNGIHTKDVLAKLMNSNNIIRNIGNGLYCVIRNTKEKTSENSYILPKDLEKNNEIDFRRNLTICGKRVRSRTRTIITAYQYVTECQE